MTEATRLFDTLYVEVLRSGRYFRLTEDFGYYQPGENPVVVLVNTETDFASIPRPINVIIPKLGKYTYPSVVHDHLCKEAETWKDRRKGDWVFRKAMKYAGVGLLRRWAMYSAVFLAGMFIWTLNINGRVGRQVEEDRRKADQAQQQN